MTGSWPAASSASRMRMTAGVVWPSIVIPTVRPPRSRTGARPSRAMPTTAAAALSKTARAIGFRPEDVDDRVHDERRRVSPTKGPNGAAARRARRDDHLRDADRQRVHRRGPEQRALRAAEAEHAFDPPLEPEPQADRAHALDHQLDRRAAAACPSDPLQVVAALARHLLARHVGASSPGSPRMPESITTARAPSTAQPLAHVGDLVALRVERPDQRDARGVRHARSRHSRVCTSTGAFWNSSSAAARCSA